MQKAKPSVIDIEWQASQNAPAKASLMGQSQTQCTSCKPLHMWGCNLSKHVQNKMKTAKQGRGEGGPEEREGGGRGGERETARGNHHILACYQLKTIFRTQARHRFSLSLTSIYLGPGLTHKRWLG